MNPDVKTILYATDLSGNAGLACRYAAYLAEKTDAKIHVLHVADKLPADALDTLETYLQEFEDKEQFKKARIENAEKILHSRFEDFWNSHDEPKRTQLKQRTTLKVIESRPAETIVAYANHVRADMIVMGTHQKGPIQAFLGSVSRRVLSLATMPTLVVPLGDG